METEKALADRPPLDSLSDDSWFYWLEKNFRIFK